MNSKICLFKNLQNCNYMPIRTCQKLPEGVQYYGFTYYPRHENFKDPPYQPSKLFLIKRIKSLRGTNAEEKLSLEKLNIDGEIKHKGHIAVVKNTVYTNALLWKVKHLVEIKPITCKGELPKNDFTGTYLRDTGEFIVSPKLKINSEQMELSDKFHNRDTQFKRNYLRDFLKKKWLNGLSGTV